MKTELRELAPSAPPAQALSGAPDRVLEAMAPILLVGSVLLFLLPWWNRYFGGSLEGYFPYFGREILAGKVPYRDFYLYVPPLLPLESAWIDRWAPHPLITLRIVGLVERCALALALYFWLRQLFRPTLSAASALLATVVASTGDTEVLFLYNHQAILWLVVAGGLASLDYDLPKPRAWPLVASGASTALALLCKQTVGLLGATAVALAAIAAWRALAGRPAAVRGALLWAGGLGLTAAPVGVWLAAHDALQPFWQDVFLDGPANKGSAGQLLARLFATPFQIPAFRAPAALAISLLVLLAPFILVGLRARLPSFEFRERREPRTLVYLGLSAAAAVLLGVLSAPLIRFGQGWILLPERTTPLMALWGGAALCLILAPRLLGFDPSPRELRLGMFALVAVAVAAGLGLSWSVQPAMSIPGVALLAALAVEGADLDRHVHHDGIQLALPLLGTLFIVMLFATWERQVLPFDFAGWKEPPVFVGRAARAPEGLEGFELSEETTEFVDRLLASVRANSSPGDPIFAFSQIPFVEFLAGREPATFAALHWYDVTPDRICREDLERIERDPPELLVLWPLDEQELAAHEQMFRGGRSSGQRELWRGLSSLAQRSFDRVGHVRAPGGAEIELWRRRHREAGTR